MSLLLKKAKQIPETNHFPEAQSTLSPRIELKDNFAKLVLICLGGTGISILLSLISLILLFYLAKKPPPSLVQLNNGQSLAVKGVDSLERTDVVITQFVNNILTMAFTWNGMKPSATEAGQWEEDKGIKVRKGKRIVGKVPTATYQATYAFELNFRSKFLQEIVEVIPQSVFRSSADVAYVPVKMLPPKRLQPGQWKVTVISNLVFTTGIAQVEEIIPYNVEVYVRAVTPSNPDFISQLTPDFGSNPTLAQILSEIRQAGLEIEAILPYEKPGLNNQ